MTPGAMGDDTMDDITSMKIGFNLFYEHGEFAGVDGEIIFFAF